MHEPEDTLQRLEAKIDNLTGVVWAQAVVLMIMAVGYLMTVAKYLIITLFVVVPLLFIFRRSIPGWLHRARVLVARFRERERRERPIS